MELSEEMEVTDDSMEYTVHSLHFTAHSILNSKVLNNLLETL